MTVHFEAPFIRRLATRYDREQKSVFVAVPKKFDFVRLSLSPLPLFSLSLFLSTLLHRPRAAYPCP